MIVAQLVGGLGNQMFQYAAALGIAIKNKQKLSIDTSAFANYTLHQYGLYHFNISAKKYKEPGKYTKKIRNRIYKSFHYKEREFNFNETVFNIKSDYIFLDGYFQSEKYFLEIEDVIRTQFEIVSPLKKITMDTIEKMNQVNAISIHIRRGDYIGNAVHEIDFGSYYREALKIIKSKVTNPVMFVFSDDMDWVKENFSTGCETFFIDFNDALSNFEDLKLMLCCKHNIIANSSFSWWGAWLNPNPDKIVIAPELWFNDKSINTIDLIPERWTKI